MPIRGDFETFDDPTAIRQYRQKSTLLMKKLALAILDDKCIVKVSIS